MTCVSFLVAQPPPPLSSALPALLAHHAPRTRTQGIGPEIAQSVKEIFDVAKVPIKWEEVSVAPILVDGVSTIPADAISSIKKNTIALKGPLATPSAWHPRRRVPEVKETYL